MDKAQRTILQAMAYDASVKSVGEGRATIKHAKAVKCGFLTETEVSRIAGDEQTRLTPLLVRCHGGRFVAPADQVQHFIMIIERQMSDTVRDISLPAVTDSEKALLDALQAAWGLLHHSEVRHVIRHSLGECALYDKALAVGQRAANTVGGRI